MSYDLFTYPQKAGFKDNTTSREAAQAIRAEEAGRVRVPILALTAHAMEGDAEGILAAGIDRHLTKPLRKSVLTDALAEFCPAEAALADEAASAA